MNIEQQGHEVMLVMAKPKNKLANLHKHPDTIIGNPDDIVHIDWLSGCLQRTIHTNPV